MKKFAALAFVALVACGKRGDPHPPVPVIPKATSDLVVTQRGTKVILAWSYPSLTTSGKKLDKVRRVVLYRYVEPLPVQPGGRDPNSIKPGDIDTTQPLPVALFAKIPAPTPTQFLKLKERIDSIEGANTAAATSGARLTYEDSPQFHTSDGRAVRISYGVITEGATATGALSNLATIVPLDVPPPPASVIATAKPEGVVLSWAAADSKTKIAGYDVYRSDADAEVDNLAAPINTAPVKEPTYTDVPPYGKFDYRVTAVVAAGPPRIESDPSAPVTAQFKDLLPPPVPTNLNALVETKAVRLVWDPVESPDLAGYKIYRTEGSGNPLKPVAPHVLFTPQPIAATNWRDTLADPGISYFYEVTSIDKSGNESAPVKTDWVLVPKTP